MNIDTATSLEKEAISEIDFLKGRRQLDQKDHRLPFQETWRNFNFGVYKILRIDLGRTRGFKGLV